MNPITMLNILLQIFAQKQIEAKLNGMRIIRERFLKFAYTSEIYSKILGY